MFKYLKYILFSKFLVRLNSNNNISVVDSRNSQGLHARVHTYWEKSSISDMDGYSLTLLTLPKFTMCDVLWTAFFLFPPLEFSISEYSRNCQDMYFLVLLFFFYFAVVHCTDMWIKDRLLSHPFHSMVQNFSRLCEKNHIYLQE